MPAFHAWHTLRWPHIPWLPQDASPGIRDSYRAILVDFLEDLMDADVSVGVPRSRRTSLNKAIHLCRPNYPWPTKETIVVNITQDYYKSGRRKKRQTWFYTVQEIRTIEGALQSRNEGNPEEQRPALGPLERLTLATELRKLYARLRQDDATWGRITSWKVTRGKSPDGETTTHLQGTEMRAHWIHEDMPWIAPTRGLSDHHSEWESQAPNDMFTLGMRQEDNYLLPSPRQYALAGDHPVLQITWNGLRC